MSDGTHTIFADIPRGCEMPGLRIARGRSGCPLIDAAVPGACPNAPKQPVDFTGERPVPPDAGLEGLVIKGAGDFMFNTPSHTRRPRSGIEKVWLKIRTANARTTKACPRDL
jgi:hypothetical protein